MFCRMMQKWTKDGIYTMVTIIVTEQHKHLLTVCLGFRAEYTPKGRLYQTCHGKFIDILLQTGGTCWQQGGCCIAQKEATKITIRTKCHARH